VRRQLGWATELRQGHNGGKELNAQYKERGGMRHIEALGMARGQARHIECGAPACFSMGAGHRELLLCSVNSVSAEQGSQRAPLRLTIVNNLLIWSKYCQ
jgi:hypothetical protein